MINTKKPSGKAGQAPRPLVVSQKPTKHYDASLRTVRPDFNALPEVGRDG